MLYALFHAAAVGCGFVVGVAIALFALRLIGAICDAVGDGIAEAKGHRDAGR